MHVFTLLAPCQGSPPPLLEPAFCATLCPLRLAAAEAKPAQGCRQAAAGSAAAMAEPTEGPPALLAAASSDVPHAAAAALALAPARISPAARVCAACT